MPITKENWKRLHRKEWKDFFGEIHLVCWTFGFSIMPTGHKHLYCIDMGPFSVGYEYKTKAYRRAVKA